MGELQRCAGVRHDLCDSPEKKSQEPLNFPACFYRDFLCDHLFRIECPAAFYHLFIRDIE